MMKGKGKSKGFSKGKNPPQQQQQYGKGKGWYWSEPWSEPWKGRSGVHAVEEYGWSQGTGDNTVLFELDAHEQTEYLQHLPASTSNIVEAVAKEATKKNEEYLRRRMSAAGAKEGAGIRFETPNKFNILGVESEVEESLLTPKAKNELATIEEQNENKTDVRVYAQQDQEFEVGEDASLWIQRYEEREEHGAPVSEQWS